MLPFVENLLISDDAVGVGGGLVRPVAGTPYFFTDESTTPTSITMPAGVKALQIYSNLNLGWMIVGDDGNGYRVTSGQSAPPADGAAATLYYTAPVGNPVVAYYMTYAGSAYGPVNGWILKDGTSVATQGYVPALNNYPSISDDRSELLSMETECYSYGNNFLYQDPVTGISSSYIHGRYSDGVRPWYYATQAVWNKQSTSVNTYSWTLPNNEVPYLISWRSRATAVISDKNNLYVADTPNTQQLSSTEFVNKTTINTNTNPYNISSNYNNTKFTVVKCLYPTGTVKMQLAALDTNNNLWISLEGSNFQQIQSNVASFSYNTYSGNKMAILLTNGDVVWYDADDGSIVASSASVQAVFDSATGGFRGFPNIGSHKFVANCLAVIIPQILLLISCHLNQ